MRLLVNNKTKYGYLQSKTESAMAQTLAASTIRAISTFVLIFTLAYFHSICYSIVFAQTEIDLGNFTVRNTTTAFASNNSSFMNFTANASDQEQQEPPSLQPSGLDLEEQLTQETQQEQEEQQEQQEQ
jgi:hypothetical protein